MAEIQVLRVPKWGLSMEEGTIAAWLISEGDTFAKGQEICEIETSKIANVVEAPFSGQLRRIIANVGETLPVQGVIAVVAPASIEDSEIDAFLTSCVADNKGTTQGLSAASPPLNSGNASPVAPEASAASAVRSQTKEADDESLLIPDVLRGVAEDDAFASPRVYAFAKSHGLNLSLVTGSGRLGRINMEDVRAAVEAHGGKIPERAKNPVAIQVEPEMRGDTSVLATPVARKLAAHWGIRLAACRPTGRHGRVCKADVEAARDLAEGKADKSVASSMSSGCLTDEGNASTCTPLTAMRRTIATRLTESKREAPHFRLCVDVDLGPLDVFRAQINEQHPSVKISVNDFLIKAVAMALLKHPECNIQFDGELIRQFEHADVSVAVAMDSGLITPIIRSADTKSLVEISNEMRSLATRAKASTLRPDEFLGGTFTISNLGMFGVTQFDAIINPPQAAILAVGGAREVVRLVAEKVVVARVMSVNLSSDHRVIDGALAARFMQSVKQNLEGPAVMLAG